MNINLEIKYKKETQDDIFKIDYLQNKIKITLNRSNLFIFCDYVVNQDIAIWQAMKYLLAKEKEILGENIV